MIYEVIVGNIGSVYCGNRAKEAVTHFEEYKRQSIAGFGRAGGESIVILVDSQDIYKEFIGTMDREVEDIDEEDKCDLDGCGHARIDHSSESGCLVCGMCREFEEPGSLHSKAKDT